MWGLDLSQSMQGAGGIGGLLAKVESGATHLYQYDGNGNVGQLVNASTGAAEARYEYDPYGNSIIASGTQATANPFRFSTKYLDAESGLYYYGYRYYDPETGRWTNRDPIEESGGLNLYVSINNNPLNGFDMLGAKGKSSVIAWVVKRLKGQKVIKWKPIYTYKEAGKIFKKLPEGMDIMVKQLGRKDEALKIARNAIKKENLLTGKGHALGHINKGTGLRGLSHIQDKTIKNKHIFYSAIAAMLALNANDAEAKGVNVVVDEIWTDPYPGDSVASYLTITKWAGEDSLLSYLDWFNPMDNVAMASNFGRWLLKERDKEFLGFMVTLGCDGQPIWTFGFGPDGSDVSAGAWENGVLETKSIDDFVNNMDENLQAQMENVEF